MRILMFVLLVSVITSCSTSKVSQTQRVQEITEKVNSKNFTFVPTSVNKPMVRINASYSFTLRNDSVISHLPFFGRVFVAPYPSDDPGFNFISAKFIDEVVNKKKGGWDIEITTQDTQRPLTIYLSIGETGYSTLSISDPNRESISFFGNIQ